MAVVHPLRVVIDNYEEGKIEYLDAVNNSENEELGTRKIAFSKYLYIEQNDFMLEKPDKHYKRLALGLEVRLYHAYFIKANQVEYNEDGSIKLIHCTYDVNTKSNSGFNERKPNGTIHFVEATTAKNATFHLFEPLIVNDDESIDFTERINPLSWMKENGVIENCQESFLEGDKFQFIRDGYYAVDKESTIDHLVFNRITSLKSGSK
jgi:glutaminyl-tRNA synthetase